MKNKIIIAVMASVQRNVVKRNARARRGLNDWNFMKNYICIAIGITGLIFFVASNLRMNQYEKAFNKFPKIAFLDTIDKHGNPERILIDGNKFPNGVQFELGLRDNGQTIIWSVIQSTNH